MNLWRSRVHAQVELNQWFTLTVNSGEKKTESLSLSFLGRPLLASTPFYRSPVPHSDTLSAGSSTDRVGDWLGSEPGLYHSTVCPVLSLLGFYHYLFRPPQVLPSRCCSPRLTPSVTDPHRPTGSKMSANESSSIDSFPRTKIIISSTF